MWNRKPRPQPAPPTEAQIQAKARELWQARQGEGVGPGYSDRQNAIKHLTAESQVPPEMKQALSHFGDPTDREFLLKLKQFHWERIKTIISAFGLAATIFAGVGLYLTYQNAQEEKQLNTERLITDRFSKSVEQLGHKEISVRIGGIYSLERIAKDSPKDHWTVMEVLTAFVRERSPNQLPAPETTKPKSPNEKEPDLPGIPTDVQSALTAIGRRDTSQEANEQAIDLSQTDLVKANLDRTNLRGATFYEANLQGASLYSANLQEAHLVRANLQRTVLWNANLQQASLSSANLQQANLVHANLQQAYFYETKLQQAWLVRANLQQAILYGANLQQADLNNANLQQADLYRANLQEVNFHSTNVQKANLYSANLRGATFYKVNLQEAHLDHANLQEAIFLATDLRNTKGLTQAQLEGEYPPLLCNVALPNGIKVNPNRDCARLPQVMAERYRIYFLSLENARKVVDEARKRQWK